MSILFSDFFAKNNEIRPQEAKFTEVLGSIVLTPKTLYFHGKMPEKRVKTVAIVGTRRPTKYGEKVAFELAYEAAKRGAIVVSGLAYGIDSIAHRGALEAGGKTIAVLGTPINEIYPREHTELAKEIVEKGGAIFSEIEAGAKENVDYFPKTSFLQRNRIISGLADAVVVVEAAERSGSLNTAAHALDQGRELFAVPGDITRATSRGCNHLIQHGANVYTGPKCVLDYLFPKAQKPRTLKIAPAGQAELVSMQAVDIAMVKGDTVEETRILVAIFDGCSSGEEILEKTRLSPERLNQLLTLLEVKGRIQALGMNKWALKG